MWRGSVTFGDYWAGYIGGIDQNTTHAHIATQLAIGIGGDVAIGWAGGTVQGQGILIAPRTEHTAHSEHGYVTFLYLAPQSPLSRTMLRHFNCTGVTALDAGVVACIVATPSLHEAVARLGALFALTPRMPDRRLQAALDSLKSDQGGPGAIARAASAAGLSEPRLRALAQASLGVPLSLWLLWRKLEVAAMAIAAGASLSAAAAMGGFADQAHLARTMRRLFGIATGAAVAPLRASKRFVQDED